MQASARKGNLVFKSMKIAVAIPAFNCAVQIERVVSELSVVLNENPVISRVFIIDNQSRDNTLDCAVEAAQKSNNRKLFEIYQNPYNYGLGGTHKVVMSLCKNQQITHVIILHGDHQARPQDISILLSALQISPNANILGSRFADLSRLSGYSWVRTAGNLGLNFLYTIATGKKISDLGSGLNLLNVESLDEKIYQEFDSGFTFNMDLLLHFVRANIPFSYVPISWSTSDQISNAKSLAVGLKTLKKLIMWMLKFEIKNQHHFETVKIF